VKTAIECTANDNPANPTELPRITLGGWGHTGPSTKLPISHPEMNNLVSRWEILPSIHLNLSFAINCKKYAAQPVGQSMRPYLMLHLSGVPPTVYVAQYLRRPTTDCLFRKRSPTFSSGLEKTQPPKHGALLKFPFHLTRLLSHLGCRIL
jgi:hypothetical protein